MIETVIFFLAYTGLYAVFEVFLLEQIWKGKVKFLSWQTYWRIHPIPLTLGVFLLTFDVFLAIASYFLYTVLQDYLYNKLARFLGSDVKYTDYLTVYHGIPVYYYVNSIIGLVFILIALGVKYV